MSGSGGSEERFEEFVDEAEGIRWRVDMDFIGSNWTCLWGDGCAGILEDPAPEDGLGCCAVGAELLDDDEARRIGALGLALDPARFQYHREAAADGVFADGSSHATRVVEGACIFLNRPGFSGGAGCALHLGALDDGESPMDWKPAICWQLPLKVEDDGDGTRTLRRWTRHDWGPEGATMAWCCTERRPRRGTGPTAFAGEVTVGESLSAELQGLVGPEVAVRIRRSIEGTPPEGR